MLVVAAEFGKWNSTVRWGPSGQKCSLPTYMIGNMGSPNSVTISLVSTTYKALTDTGAEVSVINSRVLKPRPELTNKKINLQTANGSLLKMEGIAYLQVKIGKHVTVHEFFMVKNLNRNIILVKAE